MSLPPSPPVPDAAGIPLTADSHRMAAIMKALSAAVRLDLLKALRVPRTLGEIRLRPRRRDRLEPDRLMNRVAVRRHLDTLIAIGAVRKGRMVRDGRALDHYWVNHQQVFALSEELRSLALIRPDDPALDGTQPRSAPAEAEAAGPRVTLVNGVWEGRTFPLSAPGDARVWAVGRDPQAAICLDYDPYVSRHHAEVRGDGRGFTVCDLPASRNGIQVNWVPLPKGQPRRLASGDVIGVGRSVLVFREE